MGEVAEHGLDEQYEADPLVPGVPQLVPLLGPADVPLLLGVVRVVHGGDARVRNLVSHTLGQLRGDGEGAVDPAVGVHDASGDGAHDALDGRAEELAHGHQKGGQDQHAEGHLEKFPIKTEGY